MKVFSGFHFPPTAFRAVDNKSDFATRCKLTKLRQNLAILIKVVEPEANITNFDGLYVLHNRTSMVSCRKLARSARNAAAPRSSGPAPAASSASRRISG